MKKICCLYGWIHATKTVHTEIILAEKVKDKGLPNIGFDLPRMKGIP